MITTNFYLPGDEGLYKLKEEIDPEDNELMCRVEFWEEDGEIPIKKFSNFNSFAEDARHIIERNGWEAISPQVIGVLDRHPIIRQMISGEVPETKMEFVGLGQDGEKLFLEKVSDSCFLLYAEGNDQSPFEFSQESNARQMIALLAKFRLESQMMEATGLEYE